MTNTDLTEKVWYACYGSNILERRFRCYIEGGKPEGAVKTYKGCNDKTLPTKNERFYICSELYFSKKSKSWNGSGVAFIKNKFDKKQSVFGRIYLISKAQLIDVARQETDTEEHLDLNFDQAIKNGSSIFKESSWYGNLIYLGQQNNVPVFTLTSKVDLDDINRPSENYLKTIIYGIREAHGLDNKTIVDYLITKNGIVGNYTAEELFKLLDNE